jgi:hypothetical protein
MSDTPITQAPWTVECYGSGTQVVKRYADFCGAHYHIGHLAADTEGDHGRYDVGRELCDWLNGLGPEPWWLDMLNRVTPDTVRTPHGCDIRATGPMIDAAEPPSWGLWREDDSDNSKIRRGLMTDALKKRNLDLLNL